MPATTLAIVDTDILSSYSRMMTTADEQVLIERIINGDEGAFELLVKEHTGKVVGLAWRMIGNHEDAQDLAQEAFIRLYRALPRFRGESRISTWLYRTTSRLAIDYLRREQLKRKLFFFSKNEDAPDPLENTCDTREHPEKSLQSRQAINALRQSMKKLSARQQVIFTLRHYEGLSMKEIAEHLGIETGTVKAHLHRAVTQLRQDLHEHYEETP